MRMIENSPVVPDTPAGHARPSHSDAQRWLAELEREFLQAGETAQQASDDGQAPRAPAQAAPRADASTGARSSAYRASDDAHAHAPRGASAHGHVHAGAHTAIACTPGPCAADADTQASAVDTTPAIANAGTSTPDAGGAPISPASLLADAASPEPVASPPTLGADRALGLRGQDGEPAVASGRPLAPAPRYARQLMSLTEGEHASVTIRDASLLAAQSESVARSVSLQLQAAGFGVQRIFINGQRFDSTPTGVAPRPDRLQPLFQDDDA